MSNYNAEHGIPAGDRDDAPESQADCINRLERENKELQERLDYANSQKEFTRNTINSFIPFAEKLIEEHQNGTIDLNDWAEAKDFLVNMDDCTTLVLPQRDITITAQVTMSAEVEAEVTIGFFDDINEIDAEEHFSALMDAFDETGHWNRNMEIESFEVSE